VITESDVIMAAIEEKFPDYTPLLPLARDPSAPAVGPLLRLERELFGGARTFARTYTHRRTQAFTHARAGGPTHTPTPL
jgi:glutathione S-transferase